jgi:hypothetical protein
MSKGKMMGVDFNKDRTWIGASVAFHPPHEGALGSIGTDLALISS